MQNFRRVVALGATFLAVLAFLPVPLFSAEEGSSAEELKSLTDEFEAASKKFNANYAAAKTDEEREKVVAESYPQPEKWVDRFMAVADKAPKSDTERAALVWILQKVYYSPAANKIIERLQANHLKSADILPALQMMAYSQAENVPGFLRAAIQENPSDKVKAQATYTLGYVLINKDAEKNRDEAEKLFEKVRTEFKETDAELAKRAEGQLFEIRNLSIGQVAPDIKGSDVDGKEFALSEYRGKVVVLDFWGDW